MGDNTREIRMRKKIILSLVITLSFLAIWLVVLSVLLQLPINRSQTEWATITNAQYNFSVDYPTKWIARTYGEHGFKGEKDVKLLIYRSLLGYFEIAVYYQPASEPTLQDVITWGDMRIAKINQGLIRRGEETIEKSVIEEDTIDGHKIAKRVYWGGGVKNEDVYIARTNDMIIIRLQSEEDDFEKYLPDFEKIVQSFRPLQ